MLWKSTQNLLMMNIKNQKMGFFPDATWAIMYLLKSTSDDEKVDYEIDSSVNGVGKIILLPY